MTNKTLVQLGCGPVVNKTDWTDCDGSWNAGVNHLPLGLSWLFRKLNRLRNKNAYAFPEHVKYVNLHKKLPFADNSVDAFYASHVWEHLYEADGEFALRECMRACKPGGYVRLVVPDLFDYCSSYVASSQRDRAKTLNQQLMYRDAARNKNFMTRIYTALTDFHTHKFMYDSDLMISLFEKCGFVDVKKRGLHESSIPLLDQVEKTGRVGVGIGFAVEGRKPEASSSL